MENKMEPGPTGDFPEGKLTEDDEGGLRVGIASYEGKIILNFGRKSIAWIGLSPEQAYIFGETVKIAAIETARKKGIAEADFLRAVELLTKRTDNAKD